MGELLLKGAAHLKLYLPPVVDRVMPDLGTITGGTKVLIKGSGFDVSLGGIYCKFGEEIVAAQIINLETMIQCVSPAQAATGIKSLQISVDNKIFFIGSSEYTYLEELLTVTSVTPLEQDYWGT